MRTPIVIAVALAYLLLVPLVQAEDWTTNSGKTYKVISVIKHDGASVTILNKDGNVTIYTVVPLADLPPDLQKRFHYDANLKAQQDAAAEAAKENAVKQQQQDALDKKAKADFDSVEKRTVDGQVLLTNKEGQIIKLGQIHVYLYSEDQARAAMTMAAEKAATETQGLQPSLDDQKAKCVKIKNAIDTYQGDPNANDFKGLAKKYMGELKRYRTLLAKYYYYHSQAYYITGLPAPLMDVETDADGMFSIQIPNTGSWVLGSYDQRKVMHKWESCFWLSRVGKHAIARNEIVLSNNNLSTSDSYHSMVKTMNQSTIDEVVATADYLLKAK